MNVVSVVIILFFIDCVLVVIVKSILGLQLCPETVKEPAVATPTACNWLLVKQEFY